MVAATPLLTAEQYLHLPDTGCPSELVRGVVREFEPPFARHGQICATAGWLIGRLVRPRQLGHIISNNAGVITARNPDTVRGPDISYYSFRRLPPGRLPWGYAPVSPDLALEVLMPTDPWSETILKAGEYLNVGVQTVVVLDPDTESAQVFYPDRPTIILNVADELHLPAIADDCRFRVKQFFE